MSTLSAVGAIVGIVGGSIGAGSALLAEKRHRARTKAERAIAKISLPLVEREKADKIEDTRMRERRAHDALVGDFGSRGMINSGMFKTRERELGESFERERNAIERDFDPLVVDLKGKIGNDGG